MNNFKSINRKLKELFHPTTKFNIILSSFLCIFTTFALVSILSVLIYKEVPKYDQLITGATIWTGYNKSMDLFLIKSLIVLLPLTFLFFTLIINLFMKYTSNCKYESIFLVWFCYILLRTYTTPDDSYMILRNIILFATILVCYFITSYKNNSNNFPNLILIGFLLEFLYCIAMSIFSNFTKIETTFLEEHFYIGQIIILLLLIMLSILIRLFNTDVFENRLISLLQIFIPLIFLSFYNFSYDLESGGIIQLNISQRFKYLCIFICLFLIAYNIYKFCKKSSGILISTFISISTFSCYTVPNPLIAYDFFHVGEYTVPLQQFLSFNKIPFKDFTPIHGLMDYYYATINHIFYDGKYFTINFAQTIGSIILAIIIAIIFYYYANNRNISLFILLTFISLLIYPRWYFVIIFLIVMLSKKANKNSLCFTWYWIFMSILSIAWNPSLGGSVAVGFLPIVIYRLFNKNGIQTIKNLKEKRVFIRTLLAWVPLIILGIFFIPTFFNILTYLKENMGTTLETNGLGIFESITTKNLIPSIFNSNTVPWFDIFGFVLILLMLLILCFHSKFYTFRNKFIELLVLTCITLFIVSSYIFGRYDNDKTLYFSSILIITIIPYLYTLLYKYIKNQKLILITFFILLVLPVKQDITDIPNKIFSKTVISDISTDIVYVNGDAENLPDLGDGYTDRSFFEEIKNVSHIINSYCDKKDSTFLDAANKISYYKILNKNVPTKFTSVYNISNDSLQEKAIDQLNQNNPEVILIYPCREFDDAPFSLRCLNLYKWALNSQYKPYSYNNILYMAKDNSKLPEAVLDESYFGKVLHKENLGYLPYTWASNKNISALENVDVDLNLEDSYNIEKINSNNLIKISSESGYLDFNLDSAINGSDCDFIKLELKFNDSYTRVGSLYFNANDSELDSTNKFSFNIKTGTMLIPVSSNPYWFSSKEIRDIRLGFEACIPNDEIEYNISFLKLKQ